jgi:hypothetical protein
LSASNQGQSTGGHHLRAGNRMLPVKRNKKEEQNGKKNENHGR